MSDYDTSLASIIATYKNALRAMDGASAGYIRSVKGKLLERIAESLVRIAWKELNQDASRLKIDKAKVKIPIRREYIKRIEDERVRNHIRKNVQDYYSKLSVSKHIYIDDVFVMAIECKSYAENTMIKRVLMDFDFLLSQYPELDCYLLQLESQLTGDYSNLQSVTYGSRSTHALQSYFKVNLHILTLLEGERTIEKPIYKEFKPLKRKNLQMAYAALLDGLQKFV